MASPIKLVRGASSAITWSTPLLGVFTDGDSSVANTSDWILAGDRNVSLQSVWTGTTSGCVSIELSNDAVNVAYSLTDADYTIKPTGCPAGGPGSGAASFECDFVYFRIRFAPVAGSAGKINCFASMKI